MSEENVAIVDRVTQISIHQDRYFDVTFYFESDPARQLHQCRIPADSALSGLAPQMRVRVKKVLSMVVGFEHV